MLQVKSNRMLISLLVAALTALGMTGVIIHAFTSIETRENEVLHYVVILLGIFFISEVISRCFSESFSERESDAMKICVKNYFDDFLKITTGGDDIIVFSTSRMAFEYLTDNIKRAVFVSNTVLRYGSDLPEGPYGDTYVRWMHEKKKSILNGAQWKEILSEHLKFTGEQRLIVQDYVKQGKFYESVSVDDRKHALIQMILIIYQDGVREVMFGFHFPGWLNGPAFLSRNRDLFDFFQNYFQFNFNRWSNDQGSASTAHNMLGVDPVLAKKKQNDN